MRNHGSPFRPHLALLLLCLPCLCDSSGQRPELVIRTNVQVVQVSIVATGAHNLPVTDLQARDFRVWDSGSEQVITKLERVSSTQPLSAQPLPPGVYSNRAGKAGEPQVLSMILLDALNTKFRLQATTRGAVEKILNETTPGERIALYTYGLQLKLLHDFSSDKDSLLAALRAYHGENLPDDDLLEDLDLMRSKPFPPPLLVAAFDKARIVSTFHVLEALANSVKGVPGRKNLIWVSGAFPLTIGFDHFQGDLDRAATELNNANISVYPVDARGLSISAKVNVNIASMKQIADATGGVAYHDRNDLDRGVRLALADSREVYWLTYSPDNLKDDGSYHTIHVRTLRPGVELRSRRGYYAPGKKDARDSTPKDQMTELISSPLNVSDIGVEASAGPSTDEVDLLIHVDAADLSLTQTAGKWTGAFHLEAIQIGATGEELGGAQQAVELHLDESAYRDSLQQGLQFDMKFRSEREFDREGILGGFHDSAHGDKFEVADGKPLGLE